MFMRANETMLPYRGYTALKPMFASVVGERNTGCKHTHVRIRE